MGDELTLEQLDKKLEAFSKVATTIQTAMDDDKKNHEAQDEKDKKEAQEKQEEEKKEALKAKRAKRDAAIKLAQDETDEDKKDAAIKSAMDEYDNKEHKAMDKEHEKDAMTDEEKEEHAAIASILKDKKEDFIKKILTANKIFNPTNLKEIEVRIKKASISELEKEWSAVQPFVANMPTEQKPPEQIIPYFASMGTPEQIDASQLNASSPDSAFSKFTTKELLEMEN